MVTRVLSLILFWTMVFTAQAQESLKVISVQGQATTHENKPLTSGLELNDNQKITIPENGKVILIGQQGKVWELNQAGTYTLKKLITEKNSSVKLPKKFQHLLSQEMFEKEAKNARSVSRATRAGEDEAFGILLPMSVEVLEPKITLKLFNTRKDSTAINWDIRAFTVGEEILFGDTVQGETVSFDLAPYFEESDNIIFHINLLDENGERISHSFDNENMVSRVEEDDASRMKHELKQILKTIEDKELKLLVTARFYEEYNLVADAITAYEDLLKLVPESITYEQAYDAFLFRFGLNM